MIEDNIEQNKVKIGLTKAGISTLSKEKLDTEINDFVDFIP